MRMLKTQLVQDDVVIVEPAIRTKVAWARPERAGRKANSKSTCEVQALRTANALRERQPSVPFSAMLVVSCMVPITLKVAKAISPQAPDPLADRDDPDDP